MIHDVTSAREYERFSSQTVADQRCEWKSIFESLGNPVMILNPDGEIIEANRAAGAMAGCDTRKLVGRRCYEVYHQRETHPPDCPRVKLSFPGRMETSEMPVGKEGFIYHVSCTPLFDRDGRIEKVIHVATDLTALKRFQTCLKESEEKYRVLTESSPTAILMYQDDRWIYANSAAEAICGYGREELYTMNFWEIVHPEHRYLVRERGLLLQAGETVVNRYEFKIIAKDGTEKWVELEGATVHHRGRPAAIILVADITARKEVEAALRVSEENYRRSLDDSPLGCESLPRGGVPYMPTRPS